MDRRKRTVYIVSTVFLVALVQFLAVPCKVSAQDKYPSRPVKMVVPFGPGGSTDIAARTLANHVQKFLGQTVVVLNVPGAGGAVGFDDVRKSDPDGYKMLAAAIGANAIVPAMNPKLHFNYDELTFVALTQINPNVLVISSKSAFTSFKEFAAAIKKEPSKVKYATAGVGQVTHVGSILTLRQIGLTGTEVNPIHFESDSQAILAVVRGDADFTQVNLNAAAASLKGGLIKALAVTSPERIDVIKDVPTFKEIGYPEIDIVGWRGVCGPPGLPADIVKKWEESVAATCQNKEWLEAVNKLGDVPNYMDSKRFTQFVHSEFKRYRELFTQAGLLLK
jgi:tripartite-type tricarboxylate transporter receptor subunit TctC